MAVEVDLGERGKGWHYASLGKRGGGPIGHCASHTPHPTEADARRCYRAYERTLVVLDPDRRSSWTDCFASPSGARCRAAANHMVQAGEYSIAVLCDDHFTLEHALVALHLDGDEAGDSWQS